MTLLQRIAPKSLSGRLFWGVSFASLLSVLVVWSWLNSRFYNTLDREAAERLSQIAEVLVAELKQTDPDDRVSQQAAAMQSFWRLEKSGGLLQNLYWLDVSSDSASFIASYSINQSSEAPMQPPAAEEIENLVFDYINELDRGEMVFPDPYAYGISRRFKIVLCPIIDANGLLDSVIGIEADMEYLNLVGEFRALLAEGIGVAMLLSLLISLLLTRSLAKSIAALNEGVSLLAQGSQPVVLKLGVNELDDLYQAFVKMAADLEQQKTHVQQVFVRKLDELSFTGGAIAHEIRNPLSAIEMHFGLLKRGLLNCAEAKVSGSSVEEIDQQLQHLRKLLTSFLNYSRKVQPQLEKVYLHDFLSRLLNSKSQVLGDFAWELDVSTDLTASFDPTMLQQVIENLVNNSFKVSGDRHLQIRIAAAMNNKVLRIEVCDNGPGIADAFCEKLFTPFASGDAEGSGFGLALSRKLVEAHGGEINYNNGSPCGAVFVIEVPQHENSCS